MRGDQRVMRCLPLDSFWKGGCDKPRDNDVAQHFCNQGGSWYALRGRLVCVQKAPGRIGSVNGHKEHEHAALIRTSSLYVKYGDHLSKMGRVVVWEEK